MPFGRVIFWGSLSLFAVVAILAVFKKTSSSSVELLPLSKEVETVKKAPKVQAIAGKASSLEKDSQALEAGKDLPNIDRTFELFTTGPLQFPIVETITYSSHVEWLKNRLAWVADYAAHYKTSRHFIARSLNGRPDYLSQNVREGSQFNVYRLDKRFEFHLLADLSSCKMALYYLDLDQNERVLIKTYTISAGRPDSQSESGFLTPTGSFLLGDKVAIYKPGTKGFYNNEEVEMIQIFGTRWLPMGGGYGIEGVPWKRNPINGALVEDASSLGKHETDGCIRLSTEDVEELFAIIITKPAYIHIVKNMNESQLPGLEIATPRKS